MIWIILSALALLLVLIATAFLSAVFEMHADEIAVINQELNCHTRKPKGAAKFVITTPAK